MLFFIYGAYEVAPPSQSDMVEELTAALPKRFDYSEGYSFQWIKDQKIAVTKTLENINPAHLKKLYNIFKSAGRAPINSYTASEDYWQNVAGLLNDIKDTPEASRDLVLELAFRALPTGRSMLGVLCDTIETIKDLDADSITHLLSLVPQGFAQVGSSPYDGNTIFKRYLWKNKSIVPRPISAIENTIRSQ